MEKQTRTDPRVPPSNPLHPSARMQQMSNTSHLRPERCANPTPHTRPREAKPVAREGTPVYSAKPHSFWDEVKALFSSTSRRRSEEKLAAEKRERQRARDAYYSRNQTQQQQHEFATPIYDAETQAAAQKRQKQEAYYATAVQYANHVNANPQQKDIPFPPPANTKAGRAQYVKPPKAVTTRKPLPVYKKSTGVVPKHTVQISQVPSTHTSVHLKHNISTVRSNISKRLPQNPDIARTTRLGDFMHNSQDASQRAFPCAFCGAAPTNNGGFTDQGHYLCRACFNPGQSVERPPSRAIQKPVPKDRKQRVEREPSKKSARQEPVQFTNDLTPGNVAKRLYRPFSAGIPHTEVFVKSAMPLVDGTAHWHNRGTKESYHAPRSEWQNAKLDSKPKNARISGNSSSSSIWTSYPSPDRDAQLAQFPSPPTNRVSQPHKDNGPLRSKQRSSSIYPRDSIYVGEDDVPPMPNLPGHYDVGRPMHSSAGKWPPRVDSRQSKRTSSFYSFWKPILEEGRAPPKSWKDV